MGGCCGKQSEVVDPHERTRLLKEQKGGAGARKSSTTYGAHKEQAVDEASALQTILDTTANDLIDVNRVTTGVQLCKRDYVERENQYKMAIHQHGGGAKGMNGQANRITSLPASAARDSDTLLSFLSQPSPSSQYADMLSQRGAGAAQSVQAMAVQTRGEFVVGLEPLA